MLKKWSALFISGVLIFSILTGCGNTEDEQIAPTEDLGQ